MRKIKNYLKLIRIKHWVKNLFVFVPLFFALQFYYLKSIELSFVAFFSFCLISSSIYCLNDVLDVEKDRKDPLKAKRPIAAGIVSKKEGLFLSFLLFFFAFLILYSFKINYFVYFIIFSYFILNLLYGFFIKKIPILDVMSIALGFMLRIYAGAKVLEVPSSSYLILTTFFLSLFLGFNKRRKELLRLEEKSVEARKVLGEYTLQSLDYMVISSSAFAVMAYALYTISTETIAKFGTEKLIYSLPFVVYGIFKYFLDVYNDNNNLFSGDPSDILFKDKYIQIDIILWILFILFVLIRK